MPLAPPRLTFNRVTSSRTAAVLLLVAFTAVFAGCLSSNRKTPDQTASVNDLGPYYDKDINTGSRWAFEVIAVDGQPPERARHPYATVIPWVVLPAGVHTLEIKTVRTPLVDIKKDYVETLSLRFDFEAGKHYYLAVRDGRVALVEPSAKSEMH
jgi:hypothetical protein